MTPKQKRFVDEYVIDLNAAQAAIRAGYSRQGARQTGHKLLTKADINRKIVEKMRPVTERLEITQDYVLGVVQDTVERCRGEGEDFQPHAILKGTDQLGKHLRMWSDDNVAGDRGGDLKINIHLYGGEPAMKVVNGHGDKD